MVQQNQIILLHFLGAAYKKSIDAVAETLCDKLEFLEVAQISVSPLKILAIKTEVSCFFGGKTERRLSAFLFWELTKTGGKIKVAVSPFIADAVRRVAERRPHAGLHAEDALRPRPPDGADRSGRPGAARVEGQLGQVRSFPDFRVLLLLPRLSTLPLLQKRES